MNSDNLRQIKNRIREIGGSSGRGCLFVTGEVTGVSRETCNVKIGELEIEEVWLTGVHDQKEKSLVVTPKVGSMVMMADLSGGDMRQMMVVGYTEVESIVVNGGENGGLINIADLVSKLNGLVDKFNSHTHQVSTTGTAAAQTGTAAAPVSKATKFNKSDFEDESIKH